MILKDKDKEIVRYVEEYGFLTIAQAYDIWYKHRRYGYDLARKRLFQLVEAGYLKQQYDMEEMYAPKIFYINDKYRKPNRHMINVMDVYAYLVRMGANIKYFKREESWLDNKYFSDGFVFFQIGIYAYAAFIEVLKSNQYKDMSKNSKFYTKYNEIIECKEYNNKLQKISGYAMEYEIPKLILIDDIKHKNEFQIPGLSVIQVDNKLDGLTQILV